MSAPATKVPNARSTPGSPTQESGCIPGLCGGGPETSSGTQPTPPTTTCLLPPTGGPTPTRRKGGDGSGCPRSKLHTRPP
ncbi:hypothetical protein C0Q57_08665 [Streptomyces albidoflavus]|nr:hypothetical protein C0Q57_08665 [Streptomyces albidoflavus]